MNFGEQRATDIGSFDVINGFRMMSITHYIEV
jgi:hypothetical protein